MSLESKLQIETEKNIELERVSLQKINKLEQEQLEQKRKQDEEIRKLKQEISDWKEKSKQATMWENRFNAEKED